MGYENVGLVWTPETMRAHLAGIARPAWCDAVTLHHTASPSLADRPNGWILQHLKNLRDYYKDTLGWSAGPHLFTDEDQAWGMCDFSKKGVHAVSFNKRAIGIEVLGDYDSENPKAGRGLECWKTAAATTKVLLDWLGLPANENTVLFHRDDPKTPKSCPGKKVAKDWVLSLINGATTAPADTTLAKPAMDVTLKAADMKFVGEKWCAPVLTYLKKAGVSASTVTSKLNRKGGKFYYGDEWLEGAFYDAASEMTWAPVVELKDLA